MSYLAIDPGIDTGWCFFRSAQEIALCGLGDPRELGALDMGIRTVIIEKPKVYKAQLMKGDPNDIVTLGIRVGMYAQHFMGQGIKVAMVFPSDWKGQLPKHVCQERAQKALSPADGQRVAAQMRFVAQSKQHNVWDAVALGQAAFSHRLWA